MKYRFYTSSQKALEGMFMGIERARESIYLEMYIFEHDQTGNQFLFLLEKKAREGVHIVVVLDFIGSFGISSAEIERLKSSGAEVVFFSYWFRRTHRKILIIDRETVFLGGVNISGRFALWTDLNVRLTGKRFAETATHSFARVYRQCGGTDPVLMSRETPRLIKKARLWFQEHGVSRGHISLRKYYEEHIIHAKQHIILVSPYLVPKRWLIACLHHAVLRGVKVQIIIPEHTDNWLINHVNRYYLNICSNIGISCLLSREMNHAKVMLIDDKEGTIGSQNLDGLSFEWNVESSVFFDSPAMVRDLSRIVHRWISSAEPFSPGTKPSFWMNLPLRLFLSAFHSVL